MAFSLASAEDALALAPRDALEMILLTIDLPDIDSLEALHLFQS